MIRLVGANVAVFGYGEDARAQALALRQAGNSVTLALPGGRTRHERAQADGLAAERATVAVDAANVIVVAMRHDEQPATFWRDCLSQVVPAALVVYRSGLGAESGVFDPPGTDVVVIANHGDAFRIAVHRDGTGRALVRAMAYARAAFGEAITFDGSTVASEVDLELAAHGERVSGVFALLGQRPEPVHHDDLDEDPTTTDRPAVLVLRSLR